MTCKALHSPCQRGVHGSTQHAAGWPLGVSDRGALRLHLRPPDLKQIHSGPGETLGVPDARAVKRGHPLINFTCSG